MKGFFGRLLCKHDYVLKKETYCGWEYHLIYGCRKCGKTIIVRHKFTGDFTKVPYLCPYGGWSENNETKQDDDEGI